MTCFYMVQEHLYDLKLVLNVEKTKVMVFSNTKSKPQNLPIFSSQGLKIECVSSYRYLGILIDESLSFANHIQQLVKRLKLKLSFYFRIKSCLSFNSKKVSLSTHRLRHLHILIYEAILGFLPSYLLSYINRSNAGTYNLQSQDLLLLSVPKVRTELGKKVFRFAAPSAWNLLQKTLKHNELVSLNSFKVKLDDLEAKTSGCRCFA